MSNENNGIVQVMGIEEAKSHLPSSYVPVDEEFIERYREPIDQLKARHADKGGLLILEVDEYSGIFRIPGREHLSRISKKQSQTNRSDALQSDLELCGYCLIYPSLETFEGWLSKAPGLPSAFAKKLLDESKITSEAIAKKL